MRLPICLTTALLATPVLADAPKIVTDIPAVHSLTAMVMGDLGNPTLLLDKGADPHHFQLRPSQARALSNADLVIWMGPEMTPWLERALKGAETAQLALLDLPQTMTLEFGEGHEDHDEHGDEEHDEHDEHDHEEHADHDDHDDHDHEEHAGHDDHDEHEEHADHHDHDHEGLDPHAWLSPKNALIWIEEIEHNLSEADPEHAATYAANAAAAHEAVTTAKAQAEAALEVAHDVPLMVFHDAYGYFAAAFDLTIVESISAGDAAKPGAGHLAELREELEHDKVACIFPEAQHDPAYVTTLTDGLDTKIGAILDPSGSSLEPGADLYPTLLTTLASNIADCVSTAK
ncbi:periplasmic solute binding protein [Actibacterium atlanticum]|uniref:High-affinity zinc uptake system protein ZnuA n=1 Tax=Actibacterium atlanticum TaxID=1461693 RepID=A0A058ZPR5_9RHOB|nr:zinc ABC transporter substrate-binding protein [Actibacterium atlanticum]KCV82816.1 periplasmic solute binding protein [Actibacterium atlanticum]